MYDVSDLNIEDIEIGYSKNFQLTINESMLITFTDFSGDHNPLHVDEEYAKTTKFKTRVIPGILLASFFSRLVGMHIPGKKALYLGQSLKFMNPCFIDDKIIVEGKVISKSNATGIITLETTITKDTGDRLVEGQAKVLVRS